jgi:hypothetical protein
VDEIRHHIEEAKRPEGAPVTPEQDAE